MQIPDLGDFRLGENLGKNGIDPEFPTHRLGYGAGVAGQHDDLDLLRVQPANRLRRIRAHGIRHRKGGERPAVLGEVDDALGALGRRCRECLDLGGYLDLVATNEVGAADCQPTSVEIGLHSMAWDCLERSHSRDGEPPLGGTCDDGLGDRVLSVLLDARGELQCLGLPNSGRDAHRDDAMLPERQRTRLVEYHCVEQPRFLEASAIAD